SHDFPLAAFLKLQFFAKDPAHQMARQGDALQQASRVRYADWGWAVAGHQVMPPRPEQFCHAEAWIHGVTPVMFVNDAEARVRKHRAAARHILLEGLGNIASQTEVEREDHQLVGLEARCRHLPRVQDIDAYLVSPQGAVDSNQILGQERSPIAALYFGFRSE